MRGDEADMPVANSHRVVWVAALLGAAGACHWPGKASPAPGLSAVTGSEGLVIDADGTVYFSQPAAVGRLRPGGEAAVEMAWARVPGAKQVLGLALDRPHGALYAGSPTTKSIYKITLGEEPVVSALVLDAGEPNGLTMGPDGALYYTDFTDAGHVYRVSADGARTKVTTAPLAKPNGLAFGPDGALYVDLFLAGEVVKLTLAGGVETARAPFIAAGAVPYADGLAFDAQGRAYVGFGDGVSRASADGRALTRLAKGGTANVEFGAGAISPEDLYAVTGGQIVRIANDTPGGPVPWHAAHP